MFDSKRRDGDLGDELEFGNPRENDKFRADFRYQGSAPSVGSSNGRFKVPPLKLNDSLFSPLLDRSRDFGSTDASDDDEKANPCCVRRGFGLQLSPFLLLLLFIYVNLLNYIDRGLVNGVLPTYCVNCFDQRNSSECGTHRSCAWDPSSQSCYFNATVRPQLGIGGSFNLNETAQGILAGAFMGGYCVFSPIFAYLSSHHSPFFLMSVGLSAWCGATYLGAIAPTYHALLIARVVSGIGEASFQCLAPPFIDDAASPAQKGRWLAAFFMAVPIGQALGYAYGGAMCSSLDADRLGFAPWRVAFALEGLAMAPAAALCFFLRRPRPPPAAAQAAAAAGELEVTAARQVLDFLFVEEKGFTFLQV